MIIYIKHSYGIIKEGGEARNSAFYRFLKNQYDMKVIHINSQDNVIERLFAKLRVFWYFYFFIDKTVFIHLGGIISLYAPSFVLLKKWSFLKLSLNRLARRNTLIIEINDLPFEQSIDLELYDNYNYEALQEALLSNTKAQFIFASHEMKKHTIRKFNLSESKCRTIINGANPVTNKHQNKVAYYFKDLNPSIEKYIYVGTLNKGRQIEALINLFTELNKYLILVGPEGEWIQNYGENIIYLGAFDEEVVLELSSFCNVGLIPYDEERFYYNLCYPTKVSFYLSAGLPILSTPLIETSNILKDLDVAVFAPLAMWKDIILQSKDKFWVDLQKNVLKHQVNFYWESILKTQWLGEE